MVAHVGHFNVDHFSEDEELLAARPFAEFQRHVIARAVVDAEEDAAAVSTRPTVALHSIDPWR